MHWLEEILGHWRNVPGGGYGGGLVDISIQFNGEYYWCILNFMDRSKVGFESRNSLDEAVIACFTWCKR